MTRTYIVSQMMCAGCVRAIEGKLSKVKDIAFSINLEDKTVVVDFMGPVDDHKVINAIGNAGYTAHRL